MRRLVWLVILLAPAVSAEGFEFATWSGTLAVEPLSGDTSGCEATTARPIAPDAFLFEEGQAESGCGEARSGLMLPGVAGSLEVSFSTDRQLSGTPLGQRAIVQELTFEAAGEQTTHAIFDPGAGSQELQPITYRFDAPAGAQTGLLVWRFADENLLGPLGGEGLTATVRDVSVRMERVPLADVTVGEAGSYLDGDWVTTVHEVVLEPPPGADRVTVTFEEWMPQGVLAADGTFTPLSRLELAQNGARTEVAIPSEVLRQGGPFTMQASSTVPAPPPPSFAGGIHPAIWPLLGTPILLGSVSMASAVRFYRQAPLERRHDGMRLLAQNSVVAAGYGILLGTAYLARSALGQNPPGRSAFLLMAQLAVVSFAFLALWQLGARSMTNRLQADLARQAEEQANLERLNDKLRRSNEDLARFAHIASHDLKEPLRSVQFHSERVMAKYANAIDERGRKSLALAAGGAERMRELVDGLLSYATMESQLGAPRPVDLNDAVNEVTRSLESLIKDRRATVRHGRLPTIQGHKHLLEQALQNLITNAVKYAGPGCHVDVRARQEDGAWRVEVQDDGPGIPSEYHAKVFEAFQRLEGRTEEGGTGIGLAVVQRVAQLHGGRVGLASEPGEGCTFYLILPENNHVGAHGNPSR